MHTGPKPVMRTVVRVAGLLWLACAMIAATAPVQGYRGESAHSTAPTFLQDACPGNPLLNASFEEGSRKTEGLGTSLSSAVANGWFPWFIRGNQQFNREPEFKVEDATRDPLRWRTHTGYFSQKFFTTWATHTAGVYQQVSVTPGSLVEFSAWVQIYTGEADGWDGEKHLSDPKAPGNYRAYVGIDPFGNAPPGVGAPPPDTVVWSEPVMTYDTWTRLSVQVVAQSDRVAVYTRGQPEFPVKHNDSFWDTACLAVTGIGIPSGADAVVEASVLNFRAGPGTEYDVIDMLRRGDPLTVRARVSDGSWLNVITGEGTAGWVFTDLLRLGIDLDDVPIVQDLPPTPTLIPTDTPVPSPTVREAQEATPEPTATSAPTDAPAATPSPPPPQTRTPTPLVSTATPGIVVKAAGATPTAAQADPSTSSDQGAQGSAPAKPSQRSTAPLAFNCAPAIVALSVGLLGLLIWPRRRRRRN